MLLSAFFLFSLLQYGSAQQSPNVRFQLNFQPNAAVASNISFQKEVLSDGHFSLIVLQKEEEIFRFSDIDPNVEEIVTFTWVNDKFKALEGLRLQNTLTTYSNYASEILAAYEDKGTAFIGVLECKTKSGATSRMQVAQMISPDEVEAALSDVK
jgi:hypothetical protein